MNRLKKSIPRIFEIGLLAGVTSTGYIFYTQRELRKSPIQLIQGTHRQLRLLIAGMKMAYIY